DPAMPFGLSREPRAGRDRLKTELRTGASARAIEPVPLRCIHRRDYSIMKRLMDSELLVTHASQLITLHGPAHARIGPQMRELSLIEDGAVLVRGGLITAAGPSSEIASRMGPKAPVIHPTASVVIP